ncbi:MAG: ribosome biogenesis GTPase Der [Limnochordia bacterium]|jgi:GTP-binding protein|nr:ribosome biogenesis GTPase Der [Limnochordia bacterium]MDD2629086.1 ribosome biogenesis GTPase Der [Limnochordia bacterium]MDD4518150.1 ribosome biogenesis GTPase Der [Limnochordia bacterium]
MGKPVVAIVGRPNVGKSSLFNRLIERRLAIVEAEPGITRDRLYHDCTWLGRTCILVDTGGIDFKDEDDFAASVRRQAQIAIDEADLVLMAVDGQAGLQELDREVGELLRRQKKPVLVVVNKVDNVQMEIDALEFYSLGLGDPVPVSALHNRNIGDLLDQMMEQLPPQQDLAEEEEGIRVAIVGRPNVGKSSLVNKLLGQERTIVSDIAGTTRESIDIILEKDGRRFILVDTAGMRRRSKVDKPVERYGVIRTLRAIDRCDVAVLLMDATEAATDQDAKIASYIHEAGKGLILAVNKWDLVIKDHRTMKEFEDMIRGAFAFVSYAPLVFISAQTGQRVHEVLEVAEYVTEQASLRITTGRLNDLLNEIVERVQPPSKKGKRLRIYYAVQVGVKPPKFLFHVNDPQLMHFSYARYLENQLREAYGYHGVPLIIQTRGRAEP